MENRSQKPKVKRSVDGLTRKPLQRENSFFSELDKVKNKFTGFWFVVIAILAVIFIGLIVAAVNLRRVNISIENSADNTTDDINLSFSDRLSSVTRVGLATLVFNGEEFSAASGASSAEFPIKDSKFTFSKDQIILSGKIRDSWIPLSVKVKITALVVGDQFSFVVAPNELENIVVYGQNKEKIESTFNKNINQVLKDRNMIAKSVTISDDRLELQVIKEAK